tara:strand:- start:87 stop:305 length:219 start_codon:yes stop_codon:yes gene_type:complete
MTITQKDFESIKRKLIVNIKDFANNKDKIGTFYSQDQWDCWKSEFEWDEVEKVEVIEKRTIEIENFRLKEQL